MGAEDRIWLYDLERYTDVAVSEVKRYSTRAYRTWPTDTPANIGYDEMIVDPGVLRRRLFADGKSGVRADPRTELGVGDFTLDSLDGSLDDVFDTSAASFRERSVQIRSVVPGAAFSTAVLAMTGVVSQAKKDRTIFRIGMKDRLAALASPHLSARFAGNNALPNGLEGGVELSGRTKPQIYGKVFLAEPLCCNTARFVYFLSAGAMQALDGVYDGGVALTTGVARSLAEMGAGSTSVTITVNTGTDVLTSGASHGLTTGDPVSFTTSGTLPAPLTATAYLYARSTGASTLTLHPTAADAVAGTNKVDITTVGAGTHTLWDNATLAGHYDWCFDASASYLRLGVRPVYKLTVDVRADTAANSTVAQLLKRLAIDRGVAAGDISASDVAALDIQNSAVCGMVVVDEDTIEWMDQVATTGGVSYGYDRLGVLRMRRFDVPTGTPVMSFGRADYGDAGLEQVENDEDIPTLDIRLEYARYYTTQSASELNSSVTAAELADLALQYRVAPYTGLISPNPHARTQSAVRRTLYTAKADADAEAARLYAITSVPRDTFVMTDIDVDDQTLQLLDLNAVVGLRGDRFGLDPVEDRLMRVIAIDEKLLGRTCSVTLWG